MVGAVFLLSFLMQRRLSGTNQLIAFQFYIIGYSELKAQFSPPNIFYLPLMDQPTAQLACRRVELRKPWWLWCDEAEDNFRIFLLFLNVGSCGAREMKLAWSPDSTLLWFSHTSTQATTEEDTVETCMAQVTCA